MLTERANLFLTSLERYPVVPVETVQRLLEEGGHPSFEPWLAFHERYAGYLESLGNDWAIWGLAHESTTWRDPRSVSITYDPSSSECWISCAECHPSYDYTLDSHGVFGGPEVARTFDVKVERDALRWEFAQRGAVQVFTRELAKDQAQLDALLGSLSDCVVSQASDEYFTYYLGQRVLLSVSTRERELMFARRIVGP
jgi:hypothetical protein